jgi:hypothetical protein
MGNGDEIISFKNCPRAISAQSGALSTGESSPMTKAATRFVQSFFHGAKADLKPGDLIAPGYVSNFGQRKTATWVYLTATLDAAVWGAELAVGDGPGRIYVVEAGGAVEDDPNLTDQKFPGNPTQSYRARDPLRVIGEVTGWTGHPPQQLQAMRDSVADAGRRGVEAID